MNKEVVIDGVAFVMKSEVKREWITDPANVIAIVRAPDDADKVFSANGQLFFKRSGTLDDCTMIFNGEKLTTPHGTIISVSYVKKAIKIYNVLYGHGISNTINFDLWEPYDNKEKKITNDAPIMLTSSNLGFIIAPRVKE